MTRSLLPLVATWLALGSAPAAAAELRVGVVPISGSSDAAARTRATQVLMDALAGMPGISVVSFTNLEAVLGPAAKQALEGCRDDRCIVRTTASIRTDRIAIGSIDDEGDRSVLRLRLVESSSAAPAIARITRDLTLDEEGLRQAVSQSALELFPERAKESVGTLEVRGAMPGSRIVVDGSMSASVPLEATDPDAPALIRVPPGLHRIRVTAPGHFPATERAQVFAGQRTRVVVDLRKNRSDGPLILGGVGAAAGLAGVILGAVVRGKASGWDDACPSGMPCAPGYTRERWDDDRRSIDQGRTVANALYGVAGAAALGAVIWFFVDPGSDPEVPE